MDNRIVNFEVYQNDELIFHSDSHWLHPIFEFEATLKDKNVHFHLLQVHDKIIGRAAALLLVRLDIKKIYAHLLSNLGRDVLEFYKIDYSYDLLVDKIGCQTEDLLAEEYDPEEAYTLIKQRINDKRFKDNNTNKENL